MDDVSGSETQIKAADASPEAPTVMPWCYALTGSAGSMAATAGFAVGLFAALSGGFKQALVAWLGFIAAAALILTFPVLPLLLALCINLSALAGVEVARSGTRVAVMALMGVILFVSRSLMPAHDKPGALLEYGRGAALGILAAILIKMAGTPDAGLLLLALAAFVVGLRFMPHPLPISSSAMTAGDLLASAPTPGDATFRAEAVVLVIALIALLSLIIDFILKRPGSAG